MKSIRGNRQGLVLLVVLGMLALFSLLTVTYVVFASQSKSANLAFSRRFAHTPNHRPVFEEAIKQLIRGTSDTNSSLWGQDMLGDLYGANETNQLKQEGSVIKRLRVREFQIANSNVAMTHQSACLERPVLIGSDFNAPYTPGRFLRIPIAMYVTDTQTGQTLPDMGKLPFNDDEWTGRLITFGKDEGPLGGNTFRILRYIGNHLGDSDVFLRSSSYSIVVDLTDMNLSRQHNQFITTGGGSRRSISGTLGDWAALFPPISGYDRWASGVYLCYASIGEVPTNPTLSNGYELFLNATPLNSHGISVAADGSTQLHRLVNPSLVPPSLVPPPGINYIPSGLQLNTQQLLSTGQLINPDRSITSELIGDTDELADAADFNTLFLSYGSSAAASSADIVPSFHRAHLINYIVNWKNYTQYTELEFWATLRRIQLAMKRPLALNIRTTNTQYSNAVGLPNPLITNPQFNPGEIPPLVINATGQWNTYWASTGSDLFRNWLDRLTNGAWDVDNTGDGIADSIWQNIGLPLQRTPDGKLLVALVAYHIEDFDGKIDINASGGTGQANNYVSTLGLGRGLFNRPASFAASYDAPNMFAKGNAVRDGNGVVVQTNGSAYSSVYFSQGQGVGPVDSGYRHLFGKPNLVWFDRNLNDGSTILVGGVPIPVTGQEGAEEAYAFAMAERYRPNASPNFFNWSPGGAGAGASSRLHLLNQFQLETTPTFFYGSNHHSQGLTGMPVGVRGRMSVALDRLGNPAVINDDEYITANENEYEARLISAPHQDSPFSLAEWERIYRIADSDHATLPDRLQRTFGETDQSLVSSSLKHEIAPMSRSLRVPKLGTRAASYDAKPSTSYYELIRTVQEFKGTPLNDLISYDAFRLLFPMEFHRNETFNLNRPFGNSFKEAGVGFDVDEPVELVNNNQRALDTSGVNGIATKPFSIDSLAPIPGVAAGLEVSQGNHTRQLFARNLYVLAQLLIPQDFVFPNIDRQYWQQQVKTANDPTSAPAQRILALERMIKIRARVLAQWAVNVVDFRDPDGAMTRFPYDENPLRMYNRLMNSLDSGSRPITAGWTITPGCVAWGLEQPEALLTESLAFHDTRIREEEVSNWEFDQLPITQGSLFLEIYNPRSTGPLDNRNLPAVPKALYRSNGSNVALDLSKLSPADGNGNRYPVWRVYVSNALNRSSATQQLKTPNERLLSSGSTAALKSDLTYQLPVSNLVDFDWSLTDAEQEFFSRIQTLQAGSGLVFDHTPVETEVLFNTRSPSGIPVLKDLHQNARVIFFTDYDPNDATLNKVPGVADSRAQVFYNRNGSDILLEGNQYLVVGPRATTYLGSRTSAKTSESGRPGNDPSQQRIELTNSWIQAWNDSGVSYRSPSATVRTPLTMVAAARIPDETTWTNPSGLPPTVNQIGISVSEPLPLPVPGYYYERPTQRINSNDTSPDATTGALGFANALADGYWNYNSPNAPRKAPFDDPLPTLLPRKPLSNWVDPTGNPLLANQTAEQGTITDWCTAYLQRLADPNKTFDAVLNPYITVDWIPIDLTVFNGEDTLQSNGQLKLASRQKLGACIDPVNLSFPTTGTWSTGQSFITSKTHDPANSPSGGTNNFLKYRLDADQGSFAASRRPTNANGSDAFMTLGYLNSGFVLAQESPVANAVTANRLHDFPAPFIGAPGDPVTDVAISNRQWHPATLFWANRPFVNGYELMMVPFSSPGQLGQEFSAHVTTPNFYAGSYDNSDPRMPKSPYSEPITSTQVPPANWPLPGFTARTTDGTPGAGGYPFGHLFNFFQEMPELRSHYTRLSEAGPAFEAFLRQHPKDTSLAQLLDLVDTQSPWADVENLQSPDSFLSRPFNPSDDFGRIIGINNVAFNTYRAPYNNMSRRVEPGRINLNTLKERNVLHALIHNTLVPADQDFSPYHPTLPFSEANGDIDYNRNGVIDTGERQFPGNSTVSSLFDNFLLQRQGFTPTAGAYNPPNGVFHPDFPTLFGGLFMPASEYGMFPVTRANAHVGSDGGPIPPNIPNSNGSPAQMTLMRAPLTGALTEPALTQSLSAMDRSNAYTLLHPISRLQKLVTERSNVFAVYTTIGLFELDDNGQLGKEYGIDSGEARRFKAFYVVDRSIPVGYRVGEDHNVEDTIIVRRILSE